MVSYCVDLTSVYSFTIDKFVLAFVSASVYYFRKSLLFDGSHTWIKKQGGLFDVSMGAYDGAEVCKLVGTYMLNLLSKKYSKNDFGLYRDDGLAVLKNNSGPQSEQVKKNIQKIFKEHGLDIIIPCNMKIVNYLDVTFNLNDGTYKPYTKPNNEIKYIDKNSNHPPSVIRQIPLSIELRLSTYLLTKKYLKKQEPLTKKYCKILAIDTHSPIKVPKTITTAPT